MLSVTNYMLQPQLNFRFGSSRKVSYGLRDGVLYEDDKNIPTWIVHRSRSYHSTSSGVVSISWIGGRIGCDQSHWNRIAWDPFSPRDWNSLLLSRWLASNDDRWLASAAYPALVLEPNDVQRKVQIPIKHRVPTLHCWKSVKETLE